jgi:PIN domain nuclease of toxin-antitoxin system
VFLDSARAVTAVSANVVYIQTRITIRTRTIDAVTGDPVTRVLASEVRVRGR